MRHQSIDRLLGVEAALRELFRDVVREELRHLRGDVLGWLEVVPGTIRSWIHSGALKSSRPGDGKQPGRTYRLRPGDVDAFVAASQGQPVPRSGSSRSPSRSTQPVETGYPEAPVPEVRRLLIGRSRYHIYWEVDAGADAVTVLAVWHSRRGGGPGL